MNKVYFLNTDDFLYSKWDYHQPEDIVGYFEFLEKLKTIYPHDEEDFKIYKESLDEIIKYFHNNHVNVTVVVSLRSIELLFKKRVKSRILFFSKWKWDTTNNVIMQYMNPGWVVSVNSFAKKRSIHPRAICGHVLTVKGYRDTYQTSIVPMQIKENREIINRVQYTLEYSYRSNSIDFILGKSCEANL